jgi:molybdopterin synthase catalytic subunit
MGQRVSIQTEDFDLSTEVARLRLQDKRVGAVCSFIGTVRDRNEGQSVSTMELEHYPGMTEKALAAIEAEARRRWPLQACLIVHRYGRLAPGEQIMMVATASAHRQAAFAAAEFLMDYLKSRAPFWKKETSQSGARWVEARATDDVAAERWRLKG